MGILPIDIQAILVRMDDISKLRQWQQDGITLAQAIKGGELKELTQLESSRVNLVKPHPDGNAKIEDESKKAKSHVRERREREKEERKEKGKDFEEPYKGTIIDIKR